MWHRSPVGVRTRAVQNRTSPLSTKDSYGGFDDDAAAASSPELTAHGRSEHRLELEGGPDPGPQCPDDLTSCARATWGSPSHHSLGPSKGNLSEIKIGMARADVMKDTGDGAAYAVVETLGRIGVDRAARILAIPMADGIMRGEGLTDRQERLPLIAHQMGRPVNEVAKHPTGFSLRLIIDDPCPDLAGRRAFDQLFRPLDDGEDRCFSCPRLAFAAPPQVSGCT